LNLKTFTRCRVIYFTSVICLVLFCNFSISTIKFTALIRMVKWRYSNLWSHYNLCVVGQHGIQCEVKWWRFVALFE